MYIDEKCGFDRNNHKNTASNQRLWVQPLERECLKGFTVLKLTLGSDEENLFVGYIQAKFDLFDHFEVDIEDTSNNTRNDINKAICKLCGLSKHPCTNCKHKHNLKKHKCVFVDETMQAILFFNILKKKTPKKTMNIKIEIKQRDNKDQQQKNVIVKLWKEKVQQKEKLTEQLTKNRNFTTEKNRNISNQKKQNEIDSLKAEIAELRSTINEFSLNLMWKMPSQTNNKEESIK
ncbi:hypothetical protein RFI_21778 [Reticulomyxa filosa]|uniref:Viral A-type inclusion protein n=1 Tax=Reticulomyxa filosa TaxID=46433 RepID=X6MPI0_RETFI|nr:hypothetical protein RFI_21778 [Reticulomyxa filosa]|eukprot:ETO15586.1 hypothetical protein RFI_21778 [Reticulomyxa filosa]